MAAFDFIFPSIFCVDVSEQMFFYFIVAEHPFVALLVLVNKACWRNSTDKGESDSVDSDGAFHSIEVLKVEIHSLTRKILIPLTTFLNTSLRVNWIDQQIIRRDLKGCNFFRFDAYYNQYICNYLKLLPRIARQI